MALGCWPLFWTFDVLVARGMPLLFHSKLRAHFGEINLPKKKVSHKLQKSLPLSFPHTDHENHQINIKIFLIRSVFFLFPSGRGYDVGVFTENYQCAGCNCATNVFRQTNNDKSRNTQAPPVRQRMCFKNTVDVCEACMD